MRSGPWLVVACVVGLAGGACGSSTPVVRPPLSNHPTSPRALASGTTWVVTAIGPRDAYYSTRQHVIGLVCTASGELTDDDGDGYYAGAANCNDHQQYYFYAAAFAPSSSAAIAGPAHQPATRLGRSIPSGTTLQVAAIDPKDAYYQTRAQVIGLVCTSSSELTDDDGDGYYAGAANCSDGNYYYFYAAGFTPSSAPPIQPPQQPAQAANPPPTPAGPSIPATSTFQVTAIGAGDAYFSDRAKIIGLTCTATQDLTDDDGDGLYTGQATCTNNQSYFFYAVGVTSVTRPPPPSP